MATTIKDQTEQARYAPKKTEHSCPHTTCNVVCHAPVCEFCGIQTMANQVATLDDYWKNVAGGN